MVATIKLTGDKEVIAMLQTLGKVGAKRAVKKAANAGLTPMQKAVKKTVPVETGQMKKTLAKKVKTYAKDGVTFGVTGIKRGAKNEETGRNPSKYLHLVELGVKTHHIQPRKKPKKDEQDFKPRKALMFNDSFYGKVLHPGFRALAPLQRAFDASKTECLSKFREKLKTEIIAEAKKAK
jgi:hypothetical protein